MPEQLPGQYPTPAGVPLANRCTINRNPSPGVRPRVLFPGRLSSVASRMGLRDAYSTGTYRQEVAVPAASIRRTAIIGVAQKPCRSGRLAVLIYNDEEGWLGEGATYRLLAGVEFTVIVNGAPIFEVKGHPGHSYGIPFTLDVTGGEPLVVLVDNTDVRSTLTDADTLVIQVFLDYEPEYQIENDRKGNPIPAV